MSDITSQVQPTPTPPRVPDYDEDHFKPPITRSYRLRLWPAVILVALLWLTIMVPGMMEVQAMVQFMLVFFAPVVVAGALVLWWLFASRLRWSDRLAGLVFMVGVGAGSYFLFHPSLAKLAFMGVAIYVLPWVLTAWVGWLFLSSWLNMPLRRLGFLAVILLVWGYFDLVRVDGMYGSFATSFSWRWESTSEERYLADKAKSSTTPAVVFKNELPAKPSKDDWLAFRGEQRDGRLAGVKIETDWKASPPKKLWSKLVGPSWSSFVVVGDYVFTQEQRGDKEVVVCFSAKTGDERWTHEDVARFEETIAGAGPRSTPTFHEGKIYALGATGILNCLDAATGKKIWSKNILEDSDAKEPMWGFSSSPLVAEGIVTVFAGDPNGKSVLGYDAKNGNLTWYAGTGKNSYCSPQLSKLCGVDQVLICTNVGLTSFQPKTGDILWESSWDFPDGARVVQPTILSDTDVLLGTGMGKGAKRLHITKDDKSKWTATEVWESRAISPYFNDLVIQDGYLYGFEGKFLTCVSLDEGKEKWRARGYGNGQVLLLADQKVLLVLTETGDVALVEAQPGKHKEIARIPAIKGKTWNHPVVAHGKLFVRNGEEMACFELKTK